MTRTARQVKNELDYLARLDNWLNPYPYSKRFNLPHHYSKRRERLVKMYWILKRRETQTLWNRT